MDLQLKGKRALVTGASKGIGLATAEALAAEGCRVMIASRNGEKLALAAQEIGARHGVEVLWRAADLSQRGAAEALAAWATQPAVHGGGPLDILVNNAGAIPGGDLLAVDEDTWRRAWDLKVFGYINLTRAVYAQMKAAGAGVILNILGNAGERLNAAYIAGSTGNAGLMAFTRTLGGVSHADGIRVLGINPGPISTDRLLSLYRQMAASQLGDAERYTELFKGLSFDRPGTPEECAWAATFLVSPRSAYTSGTILTIDGGQASRQS
ncbi:MAG: SDR family NAD(P)-dependent oxidoreductase [Betaproteobacteria bacterium]|nr:SDR family NAD(P)-dependent oxidoreductase [Betaproteobacteria bacterium]